MTGLIELKLTELNQLFNSMDPSPFHQRDLDHDAEEFIVSWASEHSRQQDLKLVVGAELAPVGVGRGVLPALCHVGWLLQAVAFNTARAFCAAATPIFT